MKRIFNLCIFTFFTVTIYAQLTYFNTPFVPNNQPIRCAFDSTVFIQGFINWEVYYTKDNHWNGVVDSTISCIDFVSQGGLPAIPLHDLIENRPLFIKYNFRDDPGNWLVKDKLYSILSNLIRINETNFELQSICDPHCTEVILVKNQKKPDFTNEFQVSNFIIDPDLFWQVYCYPTSKVDSQYFSSLTYSLVIDTIYNRNEFMIVQPTEFNINGSGMYWDTDVTFPINNSDDTFYQFNLNDIFLGYPTLVRHTANGYPAFDNVSVKQVLLSPNPDTLVEIGLIPPYGGLYFQEFTQIEGGLVEGSDSLHHKIILDITENFCMSIVELVFDHNTWCRINGGWIDFSDKSTCLQFRPQTGMIIERDNQFTYGNNGNGMMALAGGDVIIENNAALTIDGTIILVKREGSPEYEENSIILKSGASLVFTSSAAIIRHQNSPDEMLNIYGLPSQVDLSALEPVSRQCIRFKQNDFVSESKTALIQAYPNPSNSTIFFGEVNDGEFINIYDFQGTLIKAQDYDIAQGIDVSQWREGGYIVKAQNKLGKFVITH